MGNSTSSKLVNLYESKLKNENLISQNDKKYDLLSQWPCDILSMLLSYSHRIEQIRLINLIFSNQLSRYDSELPNILDFLIVKPFKEQALIQNFNKKYHRNVLQYNKLNDEIFIYFTNIQLKGTQNNINYLKSNTLTVINAFLLYLIQKDVIKKSNIFESIDIDAFIQGFKKNAHDIFNENEAFFINDKKLENIEYKNEFKFYEFKRIINNANYNNLTWRQYNDIFIKYVLNIMLNHCGDKMKLDNFEIINYGIDENETLNILIGPQLFSPSTFNAFCVNRRVSKYASFMGQMNAMKSFRKDKKTRITTKKYSHLFFFNWSANNIAVVSLMNQASDHHVKEKKNLGKKIMWSYVDSAMRQI